MPPNRLLIAAQVEEVLATLSPDDRRLILSILDTLRSRPIDPELGTYLSYSQRGVWVSYEVVGNDEIWVTNCGHHPAGMM